MKKFTIFQLLVTFMFFVSIFAFCIDYALCENKSENIIWDKTFGGSQNDEVFSGIKTADGSCAVCGYTESKGAGGYDAWIAKLDENGEMVWDKTFGGSDEDVARCIIQAEDGGYVLAGYTESKGAGRYDAWVVKLDENGNLE